ncbi:MAG: hypothetical protein ACOZAQ_08235 [Pseudomonadota bacterium]
MSGEDYIKQREIHLRGPHPGPSDALLRTISELPGIRGVSMLSPYTLRISYDLRVICLRGLLHILTRLGLHLDASLWSRLRQALALYSEDAQRESLHLPISQPEAMRELASRIRLHHPGELHSTGSDWDRYL